MPTLTEDPQKCMELKSSSCKLIWKHLNRFVRNVSFRTSLTRYEYTWIVKAQTKKFTEHVYEI